MHVGLLEKVVGKRMHGCVERKTLNPHIAHNPLDMDNKWMHANAGITKFAGSMVNCGINQFMKYLEIQMSQMVLRGNIHNCRCHHNYMDYLLISSCAQFENLQGDSESQELA